jgi:amidase
MTIDATMPHWKPHVHRKRAAQHECIPPAWLLPASVQANPPSNSVDAIRTSGILSADELAWTDTTDIQDLVALVASQKVSSEQLTTAFCKRAAIAQQLTKCLTEIFFERALTRARELDEHLRTTGQVVGPLHGVPVSIKDRFDIEGVDSTVGMYRTMLFSEVFTNYLLGWVGLVNKPAQSSSSIVQLLESMGAVLYVKTNVPQSLMVNSTFNYSIRGLFTDSVDVRLLQSRLRAISERFQSCPYFWR